jgi:DNA polymerase (family X)
MNTACFASKRRIAGATEGEIYKKLGLAFIPPELRGIVASSRAPGPTSCCDSSLCRIFAVTCMCTQNGPTATTIEAMGARAFGDAYIALTDRSRWVAMVHGLDPAQLARQIKEIDRLNELLAGITILKEIEVDTQGRQPRPARRNVV